jgi:hypothetical protein
MTPTVFALMLSVSGSPGGLPPDHQLGPVLPRLREAPAVTSSPRPVPPLVPVPAIIKEKSK